MIRSMIRMIIFYALLVTHSWANSFVGQKVKVENFVTTQTLTFHSHILNEERVLLVRLPKYYQQSKQKYQVVYLLDAEFHFQQAAAAVEFLSECGYLTQNRMMPQVILIGIVNVDRNRDYTPTVSPVQGPLRFPISGQGERFGKFFKTELIPLIDSKYRTHPYQVIMGWSLGGLFSVYVFLNQPDLFQAYVAISPSLWWDGNLMVKRAKSLIDKNKISKKPLVLTLGSLEQGGGIISIGDSVFRGFLPLMRDPSAEGIDFRYVSIQGEGHSYVPFRAIYEGLKALYSDWILPGDVVNKGQIAVKNFYEKLGHKYGYRMELPELAYIRLTWSLFQQKKKKAALETAMTFLKKFPELPSSHFLVGRMCQLQNKPELAKKFLTEAHEIERSNAIPDSEWLGIYKRCLWDLQK